MTLRSFSKFVCISTLLLIFAGGMVKSTESGLSVPDWPLSYGSFFPPMVGGVFYEHGHRMLATLVGLFIVILAIWLWRTEQRKWVRLLGVIALGTVILQGVLGGVTVLLFLPDAVSVAHGVLAQSFLILTIIVAYSLSNDRAKRMQLQSESSPNIMRWGLAFTVLVFIQLLLGAVLRHTESGLAIPDFPSMGGQWIPLFNDAMLNTINARRFELNLDPVIMGQVVIHFVHRLMALIIVAFAVLLNVQSKRDSKSTVVQQSLFFVNLILALQITLGALTVWMEKEPWVTSFHVVCGALLLGAGTLLVLRSAPLTWKSFCQKLQTKMA